MKLRILKENLSQGLGLAAKFVQSKAQLPVLGTVMIEAKDKEVYFNATDLQTGIRLRVGGKVIEEGKLAVPVKVFLDLVNSLDLGTVDLESTSDFGLHVESGAVRAKIQGMSSEDFPGIEVMDVEEIGRYGIEFLEVIKDKVGFCVSKDESRPVLTGLYWNFEKGRVAGTDGYRLSVLKGKEYKIKKESKLKELILAGEMFSLGIEVMSERGVKNVKVGYLKKTKQIMLEGDETVVVGRLLEGEFPQFQGIVPSEMDIVVELELAELRRGLRSALVFAKDSANIVKLSFTEEGLLLTTNTPQVGENQVQLNGQRSGEKQGEIAFNGRYLLESLSHVNTDRVMVGMNESLKPGFVKELGNEQYIHVIMPVRVRGDE